MAASDLTQYAGDVRRSISHDVPYRQDIQPYYLNEAVVADGTVFDEYRADARGKGRMTIFFDNVNVDKAGTVTVYGGHYSDAEIGDDTVTEIGLFTIAAGENGHETCNDPFPWYLFRVGYATTPDGSTATLHVNFHAF